jgi:hypothetical protein
MRSHSFGNYRQVGGYINHYPIGNGGGWHLGVVTCWSTSVYCGVKITRAAFVCASAGWSVVRCFFLW